MKKTNKLLILILIGLFSQGAYAQVKVGSNPTTINPSAVFEIESTSQGLLPPRMTSAQRNAISNPAAGLIIYNTTANCIQLNVGTPSAPIWQCSSGANSSTNGTGEVSAYSSPGCATDYISGSMTQGTAVSGVTMVLNALVTQVGSWNISTTTVNGVTFSGSGVFTSIGCQSITLTASGTPTLSGTYSWTTNTTPNSAPSATVAGMSSSGGAAVISAYTGVGGCNVGAGTNNSPAGVMRAGVKNTMIAGVSTTDTIQVVATVTTGGTFSLSTNTVNGKTFTASGTLSAGSQTITLISTGAASSPGNHMWVLNSTPSIDIYGSTITTNAPLGSTYTAHYNGCDSASNTLHSVAQPFTAATYTGGQAFSSLTKCQNKPISAQGCGGVTSVTASSGRVHPTVNINGQCWLQTNLNVVPSVYSNYTTNSWTTSITSDQGYWGYYDTLTTNGSAGWSSTEPGTNYGMLYQWCGAMDATISERSRGICPAGFHIPSDCEISYLEHGLGMSITEHNSTAFFKANSNVKQGDIVNKLILEGSNVSGFSFIFVGFRRDTPSDFISFKVGGYFTSSTTNSSNTNLVNNVRVLLKNTIGTLNSSSSKARGSGIRCLKD